MDKTTKKWLFWLSILILPASVGILIYFSSISSYVDYDNYITIASVFMVLSFLNLIFLALLKLNNKIWIRKVSLLSAVFLPLIFSLYLFDNVSLILILLVVLVCIMSLFALNYIFLIRKPDEKTGLIILLGLITVGVIINRLGIAYYFIDEFFLPVTVILTTCGIYMFGLRSLLETEKNRYLRIISFVACTLSAIGWFFFIFAMQGGKASIFELIYFVPAFLLTLVVLFTLPFSDYINWIPLHKRILKKIMIFWIFIFLIFSLRILFPDYFKIITLRQNKPPYEFVMKDYPLENKNGLEPE